MRSKARRTAQTGAGGAEKGLLAESWCVLGRQRAWALKERVWGSSRLGELGPQNRQTRFSRGLP